LPGLNGGEDNLLQRKQYQTVADRRPDRGIDRRMEERMDGQNILLYQFQACVMIECERAIKSSSRTATDGNGALVVRCKR